MANWGSVANAAGMAVQGYASDKKRMREEALQAIAQQRQAKQDEVMQALAQSQTAENIRQTALLGAVKPPARPQTMNPGQGLLNELTGEYEVPVAAAPVVPKPDEIQFANGQKVNVTKATAVPVAGYVAPGPSEAQQATQARTRDAREDRLQQNFQGEPAVKHAGALSNAVMQLRASAAQKTPQGDLNMLYGAVKLRDPNAVREGELALNNKARSLHTQLFSFFDRVRQGRILTDEERQQVMDLVGQTIEEQSKIVAPVQARYGAQARQVGADSSFVAPDPFAGARSGSRPPGFKP